MTWCTCSNHLIFIMDPAISHYPLLFVRWGKSNQSCSQSRCHRYICFFGKGEIECIEEAFQMQLCAVWTWMGETFVQQIQWIEIDIWLWEIVFIAILQKPPNIRLSQNYFLTAQIQGNCSVTLKGAQKTFQVPCTTVQLGSEGCIGVAVCAASPIPGKARPSVKETRFKSRDNTTIWALRDCLRGVPLLIHCKILLSFCEW